MEELEKAVKDIWNKWNIRGLVITSLSLQTILVLLSPNRKRTSRTLFGLLIWSAYLLADWTADYAVGQISDSSGDEPNKNEAPKTNELFTFWAMFLLLHLGGPDTITALALEDNELWLRSLFALGCQFIATLYLLLLSVPNSLIVPTSLMFVAGVIKYSERIHAMRGASLQRRSEDSVLGEPEPGIDYTRFMEEYKAREMCKEPTRIVRVEEPKKVKEIRIRQVGPSFITHLEVVQYAYKYFNIYKGLVVDFVYSSQEWMESKQFFQSLSSEDALRILEVELSFIYGALYTKVDILHTWIGATFRCIALGCLFASLYIFKTSNKIGYEGFDIGLTYALIICGITLDVISILIFCISDSTFARMRSLKEEVDDPDSRFDRFISWLLSFRELKWKDCSCRNKKEHKVLDRLFIFRRWSEYVYAYNLLGSSLKIKPRRSHGYRCSFFDAVVYIIDCVIRRAFTAYNFITGRVERHLNDLSSENLHYALYPLRLLLRSSWYLLLKIFRMYSYIFEFYGFFDWLNKVLYTSRERLTAELWKFLFDEVKRRSLFVVGMDSASYIYSARGEWILHDMNMEIDYEKLLPYTTQLDYDQSILVWHIATELLHQTDEENSIDDDGYRELSKTLSDYMMYLFIVQPSLLSTVAGIDKVRFRGAIVEAKRFEEAKKFIDDKEGGNLYRRTGYSNLVCETILSLNTEDEGINEDAEGEGHRNKSKLFQASMLAKELQRISGGKMWEVVSKVWVEMLCYAATHCDSKQHAAQLNKGGELISFVWLLMAHFGLGDKFRSSEEDSRAKLILEKATSCLV